MSLHPSKDAKDTWTCYFPDGAGVIIGLWDFLEARLEVGAVHKARQSREGGIDTPQVQDKMTSCITVICNDPELAKVRVCKELRTTRYSDIDRINDYIMS